MFQVNIFAKSFQVSLGFLAIALLAHIFMAPTAAAGSPSAIPAASPTEVRSLYVLGPNDQIVVLGLHAEELVNKPVRIDENGDVNLPMLGILHAGGLTVRGFETELNQRLARFVRNPSLTVNVTEPKSQPVSVTGAVNSPGVQQLQGHKSLIEMISLAGGLRPDAGYLIQITRDMKWGALPLPDAKPDSSGAFSRGSVRVSEVMNGEAAAENIPIMPNDVISVPRAQMVYVIGEVRKPGGFVLGEQQTVSVLQALALAEGIEHTAAASNARIIRRDEHGGNGTEIPVDIKKILAGKAEDYSMRPQDILSVPSATGKKAALRALETVIQTGSGVVVYGASRY
jgi:polysaccharide export outer membrane protein